MSIRKQENEELKKLILEIFFDTKERYGSPRITAELRKRGNKVNKKRVARLMKELGISAKIFRKYKVTTNSNHTHKPSENLLGGVFKADKPNQIWTGDITYMKTKEGWIYLAAVIDLYSRKVVGWQLKKRIDTLLVKEALEIAVADRQITDGIIFHSDQGVQYASKSFRELLKNNGFQQSMSRRGNCYDNAVTESFFHTLKTELKESKSFKTREEARMYIFEYIEVFYNRKRIHSSIDYKSPVEYENLS